MHRLTACVLIEVHDEWQVAERRYLSEESMAQLNPPAPTTLEPASTPTDTPTTEVIDTQPRSRHSTKQQSATRRYFHHATGLDRVDPDPLDFLHPSAPRSRRAP